MSFTTKIKEEIISVDNTLPAMTSFLSGFFRNSLNINNYTLTTENKKLIEKICNTVKELFDIVLNIEEKDVISNNKIYTINFNETNINILKELSVLKEENMYSEPKEYLVDSEEEKKAYLRGVFVSQGSVNNPKTSMYHMELLIDYPTEAVFVQKLLNDFNLNAKMLLRNKKYMIYIKEAEKISDFLRVIEAYQAVLYFEDVRVYRERKNITNRLNNCEQANTEKAMISASKQLEDINIIKKHLDTNTLDSNLQEAIEYREKYQELSLLELSEVITKNTGRKITKSGLNHRFRKIKEIANRLRDND